MELLSWRELEEVKKERDNYRNSYNKYFLLYTEEKSKNIKIDGLTSLEAENAQLREENKKLISLLDFADARINTLKPQPEIWTNNGEL